MTQDFGNRKKKRFNHAYITIKYKHDEVWGWSKAEGWNDTGFQFLAEESFSIGETLDFKKGLNVFQGQVRWKHKEPDLETLFHIAVNKMIASHNEANPVLTDAELVQIIRSSDLAKKLDLARTRLGLTLTKDKLRQEIEKAGWAQNYCYGVLCDDPKWKELVAEVKAQLAEGDGLERLSGQFEKLSEL